MPTHYTSHAASNLRACLGSGRVLGWPTERTQKDEAERAGLAEGTLLVSFSEQRGALALGSRGTCWVP